MQSSALPLGHAANNDYNESSNYFNSRKSNSLLIICNGHGEDIIALEIIKRLISSKLFKTIEILPLVGEGHVFDTINSDNFKKIGCQQILPSGGFSNQSLVGLISDLKVGLLNSLLKNWIEVRKKSKDEYKLIAIGDMLPLLFSWTSNCDYGFIGTPKSDHTWTSGPGYALSDFYHKLKGTEWDPWEIFLMRAKRCQFTIVRDQLTAYNLRKKKINAKFFGNPMMDFVQRNNINITEINPLKKIILLIGSRFPEALNNLKMFLNCLEGFHSKSKILILMPLSSNADIEIIEGQLRYFGFQKEYKFKVLIGEESHWYKNNLILFLGINKFNYWANFADLGLANAGTATEQIAGLGIPALSLPGKGPQFTKSFAYRQQRLLGGSVMVCKNKQNLLEKLNFLLSSKQNRVNQAKLGINRMGKKGGSERIVSFIELKLLSK